MVGKFTRNLLVIYLVSLLGQSLLGRKEGLKPTFGLKRGFEILFWFVQLKAEFQASKKNRRWGETPYITPNYMYAKW